MPPTVSTRRVLVLTLDAFSTIYEPKAPIFKQYLALARQCQLPLPAGDNADLEQKVAKAFKSTFKDMYSKSPNYGRATGMRPEEWWDGIVRGTFGSIIEEGEEESTTSETERKMTDLSRNLYHHFSSSSGYTLFPDAAALFQHVKSLKASSSRSTPSVILGVLTNSDPRVTSVLQSLGLKVGPVTATLDETVDPLPTTGGKTSENPTVSSSNQPPSSPTSLLSPLNDIDFVITSYEAGYEKPSPEIFNVVHRIAQKLVSSANTTTTTTTTASQLSLLHALQLDKFQPSPPPSSSSSSSPLSIHHLHIGDDYSKDVLGAHHVGWHALHLDRNPTAAAAATTTSGSAEHKSSAGTAGSTTTGSISRLDQDRVLEMVSGYFLS